jgi:hypothetical protein
MKLSWNAQNNDTKEDDFHWLSAGPILLSGTCNNSGKFCLYKCSQNVDKSLYKSFLKNAQTTRWGITVD